MAGLVKLFYLVLLIVFYYNRGRVFGQILKFQTT